MMCVIRPENSDFQNNDTCGSLNVKMDYILEEIVTVSFCEEV